MEGTAATTAVIDVLEEHKIHYMVVGSLSSNFYGVPRSTEDADFVLELGAVSLRAIAELLGPSFRLDPQLRFETVTMTTRAIVAVADTHFKVEFFLLSDDAHDQERFRRRCRVSFLGRQALLPTAEDVVITKLRWTVRGKFSKDWEDLRNVIAVQADRLDWAYIHHWCDQHGTRATLDEIRNSIPPL